MKFTAASVALLASSASAFSSFSPFAKVSQKSPINAATPFTMETIPGAVAPFEDGFDPLGFAAKADENELKRYREAELTHGRVAMLAALGFLVGEKVEGSSFLFDASIHGPAINHLAQVPAPFWAFLTLGIGVSELGRAKFGWVAPKDLPLGRTSLLNEDYTPGDLGFDPLNLKPSDPVEFAKMQTKELNNGRLAMIATMGFMAQELVNGKGILENLSS